MAREMISRSMPFETAEEYVREITTCHLPEIVVFPKFHGWSIIEHSLHENGTTGVDIVSQKGRRRREVVDFSNIETRAGGGRSKWQEMPCSAEDRWGGWGMTQRKDIPSPEHENFSFTWMNSCVCGRCL